MCCENYIQFIDMSSHKDQLISSIKKIKNARDICQLVNVLGGKCNYIKHHAGRTCTSD